MPTTKVRIEALVKVLHAIRDLPIEACDEPECDEVIKAMHAISAFAD